MTTSSKPVPKMIPLLTLGEQSRLSGLSELRERCECFVVVNIFVPPRLPELASVINSRELIGVAVDHIESQVDIPEHAKDGGRVAYLSELLATLGINNVNRERVLRAFPKNGSLLQNLAAMIDISPEQLALHNLGYLASALRDYAPVDIKRGLLQTVRFTTEVYLLFFSDSDLNLKVGLLPEYVPAQGAIPQEVLVLRSPGYGQWLYYDKEGKALFDPSERLNYQWMSEEATSISRVVAQLQDRGVVDSTLLGISQPHINALREKYLRSTQATFQLTGRSFGGMHLEQGARTLKKG